MVRVKHTATKASSASKPKLKYTYKENGKIKRGTVIVNKAGKPEGHKKMTQAQIRNLNQSKKSLRKQRRQERRDQAEGPSYEPK